MNRIGYSVLVAVALWAGSGASRAQSFWAAGGTATNMNWSFADNWSTTPNLPGPTDLVWFEDELNTGWTNAIGKVNNVVDAGFSSPIRAMTFTSAANQHFYTTLIPDGVTLRLVGTDPENTLETGTPVFTSGTVTNYSSFVGPGTLSLDNPNGSLVVRQVNRATLSLAGLTNFSASLSNVLVGVGVPAIGNGPAGILFLAQTNTVTTSPNRAAPGILIGRAATNNALGQIIMGRQNIFNTDGLVVGGSRASSGTLGGNKLTFTPGTAGNVFTLRGSAGGDTPALVFSVGDGAAREFDYNAGPSGFNFISASADLTNGTVDIKAGTLNVGRTGWDTANPSNDREAVIASLLFEQGTIEATNVNIGYYQHQLSTSSGQGSLTVRSNGVLNIWKDLTLSYLATTNGLASTSGALTANDQAVLNIGGDIVDGGGFYSVTMAGGTINMQPAWDPTPGNVKLKSFTGFGTITKAATVTLVGTNTPGTLTTPGALVIGGDLIVSNITMNFNLGTSPTPGPAGGNDYISVSGTSAQFNNPRIFYTAAAPLTPGAVYRLIDCTNAASVIGTVDAESPRYAPTLVTSTGVVIAVSSTATVGNLTWNGSYGPVWSTSLVNSNWLNSGLLDAFRQEDNVLFDDSAATNVVWPSGRLVPSSVVFDGNAKTFYVTNRYGTTPAGSIQGSTGVTKNGPNTLVWGITNAFTGPVVINNGILKMQDPTFVSGNARLFGLSNSTLTVVNGATLDIAGAGFVDTGKTNFLAGTGFNGLGVITNSAVSGNPTLRWFTRLNGDSTLALNSAGLTFQNPAQAATYGGWFDLNGFTLTKSGASFLGFQQMSLTNAGSINLAGGELRLNHVLINNAGALNLSNNTLLTINSASGITNILAKNLNIAANASIGAPASGNSATTFILGGPISLEGNLTLTNNMQVLVTNVLVGAGSLTKWGTSNLVLTAASTLTGPVTLNSGRLILTNSGAIASTNIVLSTVTTNGATLDAAAIGGLALGTGRTLTLLAPNTAVIGDLTLNGASLAGLGALRGNATVSNGGTLTPGDLETPATLTIVSNLTLNGGTLNFNLGASISPGGVENDLITCSNLNLAGPTTIALLPIAALVSAPGSLYTLIQYSGTLSGSAANLNVVSASPRYSFQVVTTTPGLIQVQVSSSGSVVDAWKGLYPSNPSAWDNTISTNWINSGLPSVFYPGDSAVFDETGLTNGVDLIGTLRPASVIFSNNTTAYTLRGNGRLQAGTLSIDVSSTGGVILANNNSNTFNGGIAIGTNTTLTLNQPANTFLNAALNGSGTLLKQGANVLTVIGNSETGFAGTNVITAGTLKPAASGALGGTNATILVSGGTLDVNGTAISATVLAGGAGTTGAINNSGPALNISNALTSLTLQGPTTLSATSNRWEVGRWNIDGTGQQPWIPLGATFNAASNTITKLGTNDVWINATGETYLADVLIGAGRFVVNNPTWRDNVPPTLGYNENSIIVSNGATLGLSAGASFQAQPNGVEWGVNGGAKPVTLLSGATVETITGSNFLGGPITLSNNARVVVGSGSKLALGGTVSGNVNLLVNGSGALYLSGTNAYGTNTVVNGATLVISDSNSLPANNVVILSNGPSGLRLDNGVVSNPDAAVNMLSLVSAGQGPSLSGWGTWTGPVFLNGNQGISFAGSLDGLYVAGPMITSNLTGYVVCDFDKIRFGGALRFNGEFRVNYASGLSAGTTFRPQLTFDSQNFWTNMIVARARLNIRTNDALPPQSPISAGSLLSGFSDRTVIIDLGGFNQTFTSISAPFGYVNTFVIGNSSTTADSIVTYAGSGANSWSAVIKDDIDGNGGRAIGLNVASGVLTLTETSTYTGLTTVSNSTLILSGPNGALGNTSVKVGQGGTLAGTGGVNGPVTVASGGTLAPGILIGTLGITNQLTLQAGSTAKFEVNNALATCDKVVANSVTLAGTILVENTSAVPYTNGQVLALFEAPVISAGAVSILPTVPAPGLAWDASQLAINGTLRVVPDARPIVSAPAKTADGNIGFTISGTNGQPYTVRASANVALPIGNWTVLKSGNLPAPTYLFVDTTSTNAPQRYYRVSTP